MTGRTARLLRLARPLLLLTGLGVVAYMVWEAGPGEILRSIRTLSWRLLIVLCFPYCVATTIATISWSFAFWGHRAPFAKLWGARLAGEAVNATTPTASVGGEPVKAFLVRPWVPLSEGLASVVVDKTAIVLGQGLFLLQGLALGTWLVPTAAPVMTAMKVLLAVEALAVGGFVLIQLRGMAGRGGRLLGRFGFGPSAAGQEKLDGLDQALASFYRHRPARLLSAVLLHFVGYTVGSLEIFLVLNFLGLPVSFPTAVVIESFGSAVKFATFMVPASIGALEGGNVAIFAAFGLGGVVGLSYTLIRRLREAMWVLVGLTALALLSARPAPPEVPRP